MKYKNRPLVQRLVDFKQTNPISFHVPGHKYGALSELPEGLKTALSYDVTELEGLDDLHEPEDVIKESQQKLAALYKTEASFFLVNGSTVGNLAMVYATCRTGDTVIVQRNAHKSIFNALELVGAKAVLITPPWDEETKSIGTVTANQVQQALNDYPHSKAVILTYPTYYGTTGEDLEQVIAICHQADIPVLVDEAHGAHFVIGEPFPKSAIELGADVVVHSAHKTLPAMTMASFLHINSSIVEQESVARYLQMLQSSSPSYLLMASLDDARAYAESYNDEDLRSFLAMRTKLINSLRKIPKLTIIESPDPLKLMIRAENYTGFQLLEVLGKVHIHGELADPYQVVFVLPLLKQEHTYPVKDIVQSIKSAVDLLREYDQAIYDDNTPIHTNDVSVLCYNSQELAQFRTAWKPFEKTIGLIAGASVIPYPPGIPLLLAGERITKEHVGQLSILTAMKASFQGAIRVKEKQILVVINEVEE